jgi:glucose/arabinose dehydrogenase
MVVSTDGVVYVYRRSRDERMSPVVRILAPVCAAVLVLAACSGDGESESADPPAPVPEESSTPTAPESDRAGGSRTPRLDLGSLDISLQTVAEGLESPLYVTHTGDGSGRLFVLEQIGRIRIIRNGNLIPEPFLDISSLVVAGGEQGLLGLAFHPEFASNGRFYVDYTDRSGNTVVAEYTAHRANPDRADPSSARPLLRIDQPFGNHNGGGIEFGPDGYLYIGTGDGGSGGDPMGNGQNLQTLLGKLLRIDVDSTSGSRAYDVPEDNPFVGRSDARPEIWAYGLRNPWRFSWDDETLWIADVGQNELEEINRAPANVGGLNYGWNVMEGDRCFESSDCDHSQLELPVAVYGRDLGCSVTGGYVYRGNEFPKMQGAYLFADYCSGIVFGIAADKTGRQEPVRLLESGASVSSFGLNERGELFMTDLGGVISRVVAS